MAYLGNSERWFKFRFNRIQVWIVSDFVEIPYCFKIIPLNTLSKPFRSPLKSFSKPFDALLKVTWNNLFVIWKLACIIREVKHDVYGKRQMAKMKLLPSIFSSLYSRIKISVFALNSKRHFSVFVWFIYKDYKKRMENLRWSLPFAVCRKRHA